ncbi:MAG: thioredoxin [Clostridia bacterium]|nr:thioredoxin [Clostridia bacterium]
MSRIIKLTEENFDTEILKDGVVAVVDFYADWCGPCKMFAPVFEELANEKEDVVFGKVNVDEAPALAQRFGVMSIPTVIVLKNGIQTAQNVGLAGKAKIIEMIGA